MGSLERYYDPPRLPFEVRQKQAKRAELQRKVDKAKLCGRGIFRAQMDLLRQELKDLDLWDRYKDLWLQLLIAGPYAD